MKGVILAGGTGTRMRPLTQIMNKHMLPIGRYPMIHYAIQKMADAGIRDILLVIGKQSAGLYVDYLGSGNKWEVSLTYKIQEQAGGIAQALALAEGFIPSGERMLVLLGDNLFEDDLSPYIRQYASQKHGARVLLKEVRDPKRYGVAVVDGNRIDRIEEKPEQPLSPYAVTGIYMYGSDVFEVIRSLNPSKRGELEITDVNNVYAAEGSLQYDMLKGWWTDAGTHASLCEAILRFAKDDEE
ncbi:spore coat polysaccharide biosynthesis protein SpsI [Paenibacillus larvae subsp. larvae]|uniref:Glucose-1-phosphate thymidylyltransferase n=1 Tax=Paenibacillus larvae subsp. larvae TaxID=147375 RepID=A0A2L1U4F7_9BACL|nr:sugar phosphate nucleotidyltransferase [Paenibacillus larvae]AQT84182.1 spore coat protein [Paenibacillus larvae subsp. pulvifaciens]AQZ46162.1 spore coat protein [Paenibacillus larvae subsp. pulvifaciens]AVF27827.1 spore coat polysaccharide biosynthesis protein SpsI [Paenibacillus larvae subsp. larvae]AVF32330.1 spore coat polysaccharide biosynthesis protein SpsI [Paenibacillus larvae subsp. larvae]MBH0342737.1 spore coat protein [Paenibacillus larvae]